MISFIERQLPVSKLSKESYKERKAGAGQTLTGLGKWWGRKPLVLVRATILGCFMPVSANPKKDMDIFLKIMSMDDRGLGLRKTKAFTAKEMYEIVIKNKKLKAMANKWFELQGDKVKLAAGVDKQKVDAAVFNALGYDEKIAKCIRPEQLNNLDEETWAEINHHLGTAAGNLQELVKQLAVMRFGGEVSVGDCFCGGGSIPFEAARMGCNTYASDLNPVAGLLTWAGINICGASEEELEAIRSFQREIFAKLDKEITDLGVEHNEKGDRAISYIYCLEATCPECGVKVPLAPNWIIGKATKTIAKLKRNDKDFEIEVKMAATNAEMKTAENEGTFKNSNLCCPACGKSTPIASIRKDRKDESGINVNELRKWEKTEFDFREDDIYKERLYAIKYEHTEYIPALDKVMITRYYRQPIERDFENEDKVKEIVGKNITDWQKRGLIPDMEIESGYNTNQIIRERGWTCWQHLFNARQLLINAFLAKAVMEETNKKRKAIGIVGLNKCADNNSRLCRWDSSREDSGKQTFYNQAFNTLMNYVCRSTVTLRTAWEFDLDINKALDAKKSMVKLQDAREVSQKINFWITDPPYADAVNYHELSEFFLAWDKKLLPSVFPEWYTDSKRILAVKGDEHFSQSMIEIYKNLANHMPDDGMQVVMFTHSDVSVWAQLALIMWKAGLKVTAAWNIATETDASGLKDGNYIKGTVLLVLRKQTENETAYLDEIAGDIKTEVKEQIESMQVLEDKEEPNFSDPDYVLAAYAASLKVLTSYKNIGELDLDYELELAIHNPDKSKVVKIIDNAKKIAYDCIIPTDFDSYFWKELTPAERFYIKGLEAEKHNNYQVSTYQEYARGFSINSYNQLMASEKANSARLKTPTEFAMRTISEIGGFEDSILRIILAAVHIAIKEDGKPEKGLYHLKNQVIDYWGKRELIKQLLNYIKDAKDIENMPHWLESADMAGHLYVLVDNDHI